MNKKIANQKKEKIKNRHKYLKQITDYSIPGYPVVSDWDIAPKPPFCNCYIPIFRCGNFVVIIEDSDQVTYTFFFDSFLGRLCFGEESETEESAVYIKANSKLEREAFMAIEDAIKNTVENGREDYHDLSLLKEHLEKAKVYAGSKDIVPNF